MKRSISMKTQAISMILVLCLIVTLVPIIVFPASAVSDESPTYTTGVSSYSELQSRLNALIAKHDNTYWTTDGKPSDSKGTTSKRYHGKQCKAFASYIFNELFCTGWIGSTAASDYYLVSPSGATLMGQSASFSSTDTATVKSILDSAEIGDFIQVNRRKSSGPHSMIVAGKDANGIWIFDCNHSGNCDVDYYYQDYATFAQKNDAMSLYRSTVYPAKMEYANHGTDFYAYIIQTTEWRHLEARDGNVIVGQYGNDGHDPKQIWHFTRNSDGSYFIKNMYNDSMLDNYCEGKVAGNNVGAVEYNGCNAQKWYIIDTPNGALFETVCAPGLVLDIENGVITAGTNVQIAHRNESNAQLFWIYRLTREGLNYAKPAWPQKSTLTPNVNNTNQTVAFSWTASPLQSQYFDRRTYDLRIWKGTDTSASVIHLERFEGLSKSAIPLNPGIYTASITPINEKYYNMYTWGDYITFKVCKFSNYSITKTPTTTSSGTIVGKCIDCGATNSITLPNLNSTDYTCTVTSATCSENGKETYVWNTTQYGTYSFDVSMPKTPHTEAIDPAIAPTCTDTGLTEGKHCSVCGVTLVSQQTVPARGHTELVDKAVAPSCTEAGLTEGKHCSVCGVTLVSQQTVPARGHTELVDKAVAPSCTEAGLTEGKHCAVCGTITIAQQTINATGHTWDEGKITQQPTVQKPGVRTFSCKSCGEAKTQEVPFACDHSKTKTENAKAATCTAAGYTGDTLCATCGQTMKKGQSIPATGHKETAVPAVAPTCTKTGLTEGKKCTVCGEVTVTQQTVPVKAHTEVADKGTAATCTTDGKTDGKHCSVCNTVTVAQQVIKATGHKEEAIKAVAPTCTATGLTEGKKCSICGTVTVSQRTVAATGHTWDEGKITQEPTTQKPGVRTFTCKSCGETKTQEIPFTCDHSKTKTENAKEATCTAAGYTGDTLCVTCGQTMKKGQSIPTTGHKEEVIKAVAATCTKTGLTEGKQCTVCGTVTVAQKTVAATGHSWDEGKVTKEPTESAAGEKTYTCKTCKETKTEAIAALGHTHKYTGTVVKSTCTEAGYTTHTCVCGHSYKDNEVKATGHAWDEGKVTKEPTESAAGEKTYTCKTCKETKTEEIPALGHTHKYTDTVVKPTCTEAGYTTHTCACGHSYKDNEVKATGHAWDEGKVTKEPTESAAGEKTFTCKTCKETKTEAIAALGHTHKYTDTVVKPTCTEDGYTTHTCACGDSYKDTETAALGHAYENGKCKTCGEADPNWQPSEAKPEVTRLAGAHRFETAFFAANQMKQTLGIEKFDTVVVASGMDFADALSGSYLAAVKNAPILLACDVAWINDLVKDYIKENVNPGGTVYILGGTKAIPDSFKTGLEGFDVQRLAGDNRFLTNLKVLEEAGIGDKPILVATGLNFADCLSASAAKQPILLVFGNKLLDDQVTFLEANKGRDLYIIGGTGAVSEKLENQIQAYGTVERLAGGNRFETSVMIARKFFTNPDTAVLAYAWDFPDGLCGGSLAAAMNAPLILTMPKYEAQATEYIQGQGIRKGFVLGGEKLIPEASADTIFGRN